MSAKKSQKSQISDFEKALGDLEALVERLESGELTLEESLDQFERGIKLARDCQAALKAAELKVSALMEENGQEREVDFNEDNAK